MLTPGLNSVTFRKLSPPEVIALVKQANLRSIEWGSDVHVPSGDRQGAANVRRQTEDAGLAVSAYGSYYRVGECEPFEPVLETAVALGAPTIRVWAGTLGSAQADLQYRDLIVPESRRIADLATAGNVSVSYAFHGGTLTDTNESAAALLRQVEHPSVSTFWQPPNEQTLEYCLAGLHDVLPRVSNVHVFHWWPTHAERHPLAKGEDRWTQYLRAIRTSGRSGHASLEFVLGDSTESFLAGARTLLDWLIAE